MKKASYSRGVHELVQVFVCVAIGVIKIFFFFVVVVVVIGVAVARRYGIHLILPTASRRIRFALLLPPSSSVRTSSLLSRLRELDGLLGLPPETHVNGGRQRQPRKDEQIRAWDFGRQYVETGTCLVGCPVIEFNVHRAVLQLFFVIVRSKYRTGASRPDNFFRP